MKRINPKPNTLWKHFKGNMYTTICIADHTESNEEMVVYKGNGKIWVRPLNMFMDKVDKSKYPDCKQKYRFEEVTE